MNEASNRQVVEALWQHFDRFEFEAVGPLLHDDFVLEWPLTGERIRGRDNFIAVNKYYPGQWRIRIHKIIVSGDEVVTEITAEDGNERNPAISFFECQDGKILKIREYWPLSYPPQEWRAQWVEMM